MNRLLFQEMVKIAELVSDETFSIPVDPEGLVPLLVLQQYFPGTLGLMYLGEDSKEKILFHKFFIHSSLINTF